MIEKDMEHWQKHAKCEEHQGSLISIFHIVPPAQAKHPHPPPSPQRPFPEELGQSPNLISGENESETLAPSNNTKYSLCRVL